jgi:parallel beta helix pectate lyase-like protein/hemolysin type calcium-binding protein
LGKRITAGTGASLGALLALPAVAHAEDFQVTNLNSQGTGSLFDAINDATAPGPDRILFKSSLSGTINPARPSGALYIAGGGGDLEIIGPGARKVTVVGQNGYPGLVPWATYNGIPGADLTISGLRFADSVNDGPLVVFGNSGGGLQIYGDMDVTLSRVTIAGNHAAEDGGGIAVIPGLGSPSLVVENSTISGNSADEPGATQGGGMSLSGVDASVRSSTVSGNVSTRAGGIWSFESQLELRNSTVARNTATAGYAGGFWLYDTTADFRGTIVAENVAPDFGTDVFSDSGVDLSAAFTLIGDTTSANIDDDLGGNLLNADPKLKPLKNNGGPTDTHAFKKSPAKNKGPSDAPNSDQRGAPRKGKPDIGAYELAKCRGVIVNRVGTAKKDKLKGTKKKDGILGLGGNDKLSGKKGKDGLCGGQGKDKLKGGPGKDRLNGGPGKDKEIQ